MTTTVERFSRITRTAARALARIDGRVAMAAATLSLLFVVHCWMPLRPSGLFRDLVDATALAESGQLPRRDPLSPYADPARYAVLNAGGGLIELAAWRTAGADGLVVLSAAFACGAVGLWMLLAARRSGEFSAAAPALLWMLAIEWGAFDAAGTHRFGRLALPATLLLLDAAGVWRIAGDGLAPERSRAARPLAVTSLPLLFVLWTNLDASWSIGLGVVWLIAIGGTIERMRTRRSDRTVKESIQGKLAVALGCTLATLANPYGWKLWGLATLPYANNPFVATLGPLQPAPAWSLSGALAMIALLAAGIVLSRRLTRWTATDSLLLVAGIILTFAHPLARVWTLPLTGLLVLPPVWRELVDRLRRQAAIRTRRVDCAWLRASRTSPTATDAVWREPELDDRKTDRPTFSLWPAAICGLALAGAALSTPLGDRLFGRERTPLAEVVVDAPLAEAPADLFERGVAFVPPWWSDAFAFQASAKYDGDRDHVPRLLSDSRQVGLPPSVREDVDRVLAAEEGWTRVLDRYAVKTLLLDARRQATLLDAARTDAHWREIARTGDFVLFAREERIR